MPLFQQPEMPFLTVEEFLEWDSGTDNRYELVKGKIIAMAPTTPVHGKIATRLTVAMQRHLHPPCDVIVEAGVRLPDKSDTYYQADVAVSCTPFGPIDRFLPNPIVLVEILSPSTQFYDRGNKIADYRTLPTVREIVLVSSTSVHIELWRRTLEGWLVMDLIGRDTRLTLESIDIELTLTEIYEGIEFT